MGSGRVVLSLRFSGLRRDVELCANHHGHCYCVCSHIILVASKEGLAPDGSTLDLGTMRGSENKVESWSISGAC